MAEEFIEDIYKYSKLISELRQVVRYIRIYDDHHAVMVLEELFPQICSLCEMAVRTEYPQIDLMWEKVVAVQKETADISIIGDLLENGVIPQMELWVQSLGRIVQEVDDTYVLESSNTGFLTMRSKKTGMYLHSKNDPMDAAKQYVSARYDAKKQKYSVLGCGMGYHIYMLYKESNGSIPIEVYEEDERVVRYARAYGVLDWIPQDRIKIVTQDCVMEFLKSLEDSQSGALMYLPSVNQLSDDFEKELVIKLGIAEKTFLTMGREMVINNWRNIEKNFPEAVELRDSFEAKEIVVVAAGPSLDDSLETIKSWQGKKAIICVGTVFKKLIKRGVKPDYVVVTDPQKRTMRQIEGVEEETVPMILGMDAYWGFAELYKGEKNIVYSYTYDKEVSDYVSSNAKAVWSVGSTVTYLAVEMAIQMGAKKIYLAGVDLAFPGGVTHATDTLDRATRNDEDLLPVCGVGGTTVYTDSVFAVYREELEERIAQTEGIVFYNMSRVGARIKGTIERNVD